MRPGCRCALRQVARSELAAAGLVRARRLGGCTPRRVVHTLSPTRCYRTEADIEVVSPASDMPASAYCAAVGGRCGGAEPVTWKYCTLFSTCAKQRERDDWSQASRPWVSS